VKTDSVRRDPVLHARASADEQMRPAVTSHSATALNVVLTGKGITRSAYARGTRAESGSVSKLYQSMVVIMRGHVPVRNAEKACSIPQDWPCLPGPFGSKAWQDYPKLRPGLRRLFLIDAATRQASLPARTSLSSG
jgi:hypothetical protein